MIKIGDFAKLFNISINAVRFYEKKGLLNPCYIDIYSGYRYYNEKNIEEMTVILNLKDLGFTLEQIRNFEKNDLDNKIKEYNDQIIDISKKIHILKTFSEMEGSVLKMRKFIVDEEVIGKWKLIGISNNMDMAIKKEFVEDDFEIKELYFLPNGEDYWVLSWTKGILYINDIENKYEIKDGLLYVNITDVLDINESKIAVYENINHDEYDRESIRKRDEINQPFIPDGKLNGFWKVIDFVNDMDQFMPNKRLNDSDKLWLKKISVAPSGDVIMITKDDKRECHYTNEYIYEFCMPHTVSRYFYKEFSGKTYLIVEWKSGDYSYGGMINYYCFEKEE